jgi:metallo-beta-lactamase family protein
MTVTMDFHGAAGSVTGSCYRIAYPQGSFLVDCGMFQGSKTLNALNHRPLPFDPRALSFVVLTHAHIDHSGQLPRLTKAGYRGPIFTSPSTGDLLTFMLPDSGSIQESEVERLNRRVQQRGQEKLKPIYTLEDAKACLEQMRDIAYEQWLTPSPGVRVRFWNAGHILGSASIEIEVETGDKAHPTLRLLFSGDLGPSHKSFHPDPDAPEGYDYVVTESTYGGRDRPEATPEQRRARLRDEVKAALDRGGNLLIPSFAVERTQELMSDLAHLFRDRELPQSHVYIDSPLAVRATKVFIEHAKDLEDMEDGSPFEMPNFHYVETVDQSKALNIIKGGAIILSASGMCDAGRIRHHLKHNLWRPESTVLFVGYQAPGTLGQLLTSGAKTVRIHNEEVVVRAAMRRLDGYSGHADGPELVTWIKERLPVKSGIFITHGEQESRQAFKSALVQAGCDGGKIFLPELDDRFDLIAGAMDKKVEHRLPVELVGTEDWHNRHAAFVLDLRQRLAALKTNAERERVLSSLQELLRKSA